MIIKTDAEGEQQWSRMYHALESESAKSIIQTTDGNYIFVGSTKFLRSPCICAGPPRDSYAWLVKINSNGELLWEQTFGELKSNHANSVIQTNDGSFTLVGDTQSDNSSFSDAWVMKTAPSSNISELDSLPTTVTELDFPGWIGVLILVIIPIIFRKRRSD